MPLHASVFHCIEHLSVILCKTCLHPYGKASDILLIKLITYDYVILELVLVYMVEKKGIMFIMLSFASQ
jgi:hypothetical protein